MGGRREGLLRGPEEGHPVGGHSALQALALGTQVWGRGRGRDVFSPSKQCLEDCANQGAPTYRDLLFLDQSVYLGRPAGKSELVGAEYATPPGRSQGGTEARKGKLNTFDAELERCIDRGNATGLDAFVLNLATLLSKHDHPFSYGAAARINQWWMSLTQVMAKRRPDVKLAYISGNTAPSTEAAGFLRRGRRLSHWRGRRRGRRARAPVANEKCLVEDPAV